MKQKIKNSYHPLNVDSVLFQTRRTSFFFFFLFKNITSLFVDLKHFAFLIILIFSPILNTFIKLKKNTRNNLYFF